MGGSRGGGGSGPPLKIHKNIGFLSNTGPDPQKNHKATKPAFNVGQSSAPASETPFRWHFAGGPMIAHLKCYLDPLSPHQLKKKLSNLDHPLTKPSGSAHVHQTEQKLKWGSFRICVCSDFIWDFRKLAFPSHLETYFIKIGKISAKIPEIGKIKAIFGLGTTPI